MTRKLQPATCDLKPATFSPLTIPSLTPARAHFPKRLRRLLTTFELHKPIRKSEHEIPGKPVYPAVYNRVAIYLPADVGVLIKNIKARYPYKTILLFK